MRRIAPIPFLRGLVLALLAVFALASCSGRSTTRSNLQPAADVPSSFDLTLLADKDGQFDMDGATLTEEDVKGNLRYRVDQGSAVHTILLKRNVKQKVTARHINSLARMATELQLRAFLQEDAGAEISEVRLGTVK